MLKKIVIISFLMSTIFISLKSTEGKSDTLVNQKRFLTISGKIKKSIIQKTENKNLLDQKSEVYLIIDNNKELRKIKVGPLWFLEEIEFENYSDQVVIIRGFEEKNQNTRKSRLIVAQRIMVNNQMFTLRDARGKPKWINFPTRVD